MKKYSKIILIYFVALLIGVAFIYLVFMPIFYAKSLIFPYAVHPFDICKVYPKIWLLIKRLYIITFIISYSILLIKILKKFKSKYVENNNTSVIEDYKLNNEINLAELDKVQGIYPVYTLTSGITQNYLFKLINIHLTLVRFV